MKTANIDIESRVAQIRERIARAAQKAGRKPEDIQLVAVTKGADAQAVLRAKAAGLGVFGENRVQDCEEKVRSIADAQWHFIGYLQSNKVPAVVELFSCVQSVDTMRLAEKLNAEAASRGKVLPVLLEINAAAEPQKYGFTPEEVYGVIDAFAPLQSLRVMGIMGMAPNDPDPEVRRATFKKLRGVFGVCKSIKQPNVEMKTLSMGMSDDFETAIEEGSTMLRIGRALFAEGSR